MYHAHENSGTLGNTSNAAAVSIPSGLKAKIQNILSKSTWYTLRRLVCSRMKSKRKPFVRGVYLVQHVSSAIRAIHTCQALRPTSMPVVPRVLNRFHDKIVQGMLAAGGLKTKLFIKACEAKARKGNGIQSPSR